MIIMSTFIYWSNMEGGCNVQVTVIWFIGRDMYNKKQLISKFYLSPNDFYYFAVYVQFCQFSVFLFLVLIKLYYYRSRSSITVLHVELWLFYCILGLTIYIVT